MRFEKSRTFSGDDYFRATDSAKNDANLSGQTITSSQSFHLWMEKRVVVD